MNRERYRQELTAEEKVRAAKYRQEFALTAKSRENTRAAFWRDYAKKAVAERNRMGPPGTRGRAAVREHDIYPTMAPNAKSGKMENNFRRMESGRPPLGRDGRPVELHHRKSIKASVIDRENPNRRENYIPWDHTQHKVFNRTLHDHLKAEPKEHGPKMKMREESQRRREKLAKASAQERVTKVRGRSRER